MRQGRSRAGAVVAALVAGVVVLALHPMPWLAFRALNRAARPGGADGREDDPAALWTSPVVWVAVVAYVVVLAAMATRPRPLSGGYVGGVVAATGSAYLLAGAVGAVAGYGGGLTTAVVVVLLAAVPPAATLWVVLAVTVAVLAWLRRAERTHGVLGGGAVPAPGSLRSL